MYPLASRGRVTSGHGGLLLKVCNGSTLSELRAAEVGHNLCCRIGSFVRKVELLNTGRVSEIPMLCVRLFRDCLLLPKRTHRLPWRDTDRRVLNSSL
jgi:hypothetical protein